MSPTFHVAPPTGERWTARSGHALVGHAVRYGKLGKVGSVERAVPVDSGRALRLHVVLTRHIASPNPREFGLYDESKRSRRKKP